MAIAPFNAIIVGAGPAGCAAAYDLHAAGRQVLLLDKSRFPRMKPCAGALTPKTLNALRFDVAPVIRRSCSQLKLSLSDKSKTFDSPLPIAAMTVRSEFDAFVLDRCLSRGIDFKAPCRILSLARDANQWKITTNVGEFSAPFLIGADGANSQIRKLLFTHSPLKFGVALETCIPVEDPATWQMEFDFAPIDHGYAWIFPKHNHLDVGLYTLNLTIHQAAEKLAQFAKQKTGRRITNPIHGHKIPHNGRVFRNPWPNACLVGDAAGCIDPFLGEGIHNAIRSGQAVAEAIIHAQLNRADFNTAQREIQDDLAAYASETRRFYANITRGYRRLTRWPLGKALTKGFAQGLTVSQIKRRFIPLALT
jgi:geranylgeranyl reductase family protein